MPAGQKCTLYKALNVPFCVQAVAYGMGGGLLQRVNRDTMQFATKLCHIVYADGSKRDIAKMPKSDAAKTVRLAAQSHAGWSSCHSLAGCWHTVHTLAVLPC